MSIHYFHSHQINILFFKAICQNLCVPRMIRQPPCPKLSRTHWMIWHTPGSSGPGTLGIYSPRPLEALTLSHSFLPPPPPIPSLRAWRFEASAVGFCCEGVLWIPHASETPIPSVFPQIRVGKTQGISFIFPVARSLNVEGLRWIPLGDRLLVPPRCYA